MKGNDMTEIFDCHLHSPADRGEAWQWHKVTATFDDFVRYLDRDRSREGDHKFPEKLWTEA